jgi:hypothetical protein
MTTTKRLRCEGAAHKKRSPAPLLSACGLLMGALGMTNSAPVSALVLPVPIGTVTGGTIPIPAISPIVFGGPAPINDLVNLTNPLPLPIPGGELPGPFTFLLGGGAVGNNVLASLLNSVAGEMQVPHLRDGIAALGGLLPGAGTATGSDLSADYVAANPCPTGPDLTQGAVYHGSQEFEGNRVYAWFRDCNGVLTPAGTFAAGGLGSGLGSAVNGFNGGATQGGLRLSEDGRFLFGTNTGSNEVFVMRVDPTELVMVDRQPSGGRFPTALATKDVTFGSATPGVLYVQNRIDGNMKGWYVSGEGKLTEIPQTQQWTGAEGPLCNVGEINFTPDGSKMLGVCRATEFPFFGLAPIGFSGFSKWIDAWTMRADGSLSNQVSTDANQYEPFAFDFDMKGRMINAEGNFITVGAGIVSMYEVGEDNVMRSQGNSPVNMLGQGDSCWLRVLGPNNDQGYVMGFNEGTIVHFTITEDGIMTPNRVVANTSVGGLPIPAGFDIWESRDDKFLYSYNWPGGLQGYRVNDDHSLSRVTYVPGPFAGFARSIPILPQILNLDSFGFALEQVGSYSMVAW